MGNVTRADLRRMIAQKLGKFAEGYPTTVSGTTIVDVNTPDRKRENDDYWNGSTMLIANGTGGPGNQLVDESTVSETETSGAVVTPASTTDPFDTTCIKIVTSATAGSVGVATYAFNTTAARIAEVEFMAKGDGDVCGRWGFRASTGATTDVIGTWSSKAGEPTYITAERWTRFIRQITIPANATACSLDLYSSSELSKTVWFDRPRVRLLGQERYISDWVNSTSTFTVATFTTNPTVGSRYEVYYKDFTLADYNRAINDAMRAAFPFIYEQAEDTSITTSSSTYAYDLPDNMNPDGIIRVEMEDDTSTATAPYARQVFWRVRKQGQTAQLQLDLLPPSDRTIRITYCKPLEPLQSDFDTVDDRWVPYLTARARAELYRMWLGKLSRSDRVQVGENGDSFLQEAAFALGQVRMNWPATHIKPRLT